MTTEVQSFIDDLNARYNDLHRKFEDNFWSVKMALKDHSTDELTRTKNEYEDFLREKPLLEKVREHLKGTAANEEQKRILAIMEKTFLCYITEGEGAVHMKQETVRLESNLEKKRNNMPLGYICPETKEKKLASGGVLSIKMVNDESEAVRKACYEGLRTIGPYVVEDFCEIIKLRNKVARLCGYDDYYEYKIQTTEGINKTQLFEILDDLEQKTREANLKARKHLAETKGEQALLPYNFAHSISGNIIKEMDKYFPFKNAVGAWARSFAALGIEYQKSTMNLDLCVREAKYDNGFCHWPQCPYIKPNGELQTCITNFTCLCQPNQIGSGKRALETLMHEGGHAAAFANIHQPSPFFAQERAPMSVAYAENQSMFLDSLVGDAAWLARYAKSESGEVIPWELIEKSIRMTHNYRVFRCRGMLRIPYFEKALYELPEDQVTPENVLRISDEIDEKIDGGPSGRPLMTVPHILADESSCYYQAYIMAEMSVYQTRAHFMEKYGSLTDNEQVGKDLREIYWKPGNSVSFFDLVKKMTGKPLVADDLVARYDLDLEERLSKEKKAYEEALKVGPKYTEKDDILPQLNMRIRLVHGDEIISDTENDGFTGALDKYNTWLDKKFPKEA